MLEHLKLALYHKRLKAYLIRYALSDLKRTMYWEDIKPLYVEIKRLYKEMLAESKRLAEVLYLKRKALKESLRSRNITKEQYEEEQAKLETETWSALQELRARYDKAFGNLERRIKARFRARRPRAIPQVLIHVKLNTI